MELQVAQLEADAASRTSLGNYRIARFNDMN
jgi:hypothetical protein